MRYSRRMTAFLSLLSFLAAPALADAPAGFKEAKQANDCTVYKGPADADGVIPVFADCHWPEVSPAKLHAIEYDWEGHADVFSTVVSSKILRKDGERSRVYQMHALSGVSNREVEVWMWREEVPGGFQYNWASDTPVTPKDGNVATAKHVGFWRITDHPKGGSRAEYQLSYDPGGSVPGFLVRWFQTSGTVDTTTELRAAANK